MGHANAGSGFSLSVDVAKLRAWADACDDAGHLNDAAGEQSIAVSLDAMVNRCADPFASSEDTASVRICHLVVALRQFAVGLLGVGVEANLVLEDYGWNVFVGHGVSAF